jgi:hypothetical protein
MNDKLNGSLEPIGGAHTSNQVTASGSASAEKIDQVGQGEFVDDAKLSAGNQRIHNVIEADQSIQDEAVLKKELIAASDTIKAKDITACRFFVQNAQPKGLRLFTYLFFPILLMDIYSVWKHAESIRNLKKAADIYQNYYKNLEAKIEIMLNENFVKMALSESGKRKLESSSTPLLERVLIDKLRKYPINPEIKENQEMYREDLLLSILGSGNLRESLKRKFLIDSTIRDYIDKNIRIDNGLKYRAKLVSVADFYTHQDEFTPLMNTSLIQGDGSTQKQMQELKDKLSSVIKQRSNRVFQASVNAVKSEVEGLGKDIVTKS